MKEIRKIVAAYDSIDRTKDKVALAAVVNVEESSYRRIGARMLVSTSGQWVGGISGGCLEGDALRKSQKAIYNNSPTTVIYDTMEDDSNQIGVGLGCNGRIEVLVTPIDFDDPINPVELLRDLINIKEPQILLQVIGHSKEKNLLGTCTVIDMNAPAVQEFCGIEKDVIKNGIRKSKHQQRATIISHINKASAQVELLAEYIVPETKLIVIGDNYDVNTLLALANELGWEIHLVANSAKLNKKVLSLAQKVYGYDEVDQLPIDNFTAIVMMSHDFKRDKLCLKDLIKKKPKYLGMLGPKKRLIKMENELNLYDLNSQSFFYSPIGLDIGAESPEEIALSIAAEIVAAFKNRNGLSLKYKKGPIHIRH